MFKKLTTFITLVFLAACSDGLDRDSYSETPAAPTPTPMPTPAPTPAPNITDVTHSDDFESYDANSISTDWNWAAYVNQFDGSGNYTGGYAVAPAPIAGPQISAVNITESGNSLNVYSNYDDGTHNGGILETNVFRELGADQGYLTSDMVGTYRMSFKATTNDCGGTNSNNDATGGVCKAFVKVINSSDFSQILFDSVETQGASGETMNLDFEITEAMVGHIYQSGFMNTASNYAPTSMFYDDVVVAAYTPEPTPAPTPAPEDGTLFTETMADYSADSENLAPWTAYINRYDADGNYQNGYSVSPAPNGPQISAWATGEEGSDNDDGTGYLNAYSNYDDSHHQSGIMETNLYAEFTITEDMVGDITASFIAKRPETASNACGGANADNGATGATCAAFVKILNPSNNYATELFTTLDMTEISSTEWSSHVITATIAAGDVGKLIQFGSQNTATNYAPTGVYYDNMNVSKATSAGTAQDLFISEMGEGPSGTGSWGKYLEIANFTGAEVSLDGYILGKITNGGDPYESYVNFASGATIANGDVYVIGRATSSDADAPADLVDNIDEVNSFISHNGDDAYGLLKGTSDSYTVMDVFGPEGTYTDPGAAHTACGDAETRDSSWMKKADKEGTTSWATSAGTSAEDCHWTITTYDSSTLDYSTVGSHTFTGSGD